MRPEKLVSQSIVLTLLSFLGTSAAIASSPRLRESVKIISLELVGSPLPGNTVDLKVNYSSLINGSARIVVGHSGAIILLGSLPSESRFERDVVLTAGETVEQRFPMKVEKAGASHIYVGISLVTPREGYSAGAVRYLNLESTDRVFRVFGDRDTSQGMVRIINARRFGEAKPSERSGKQSAPTSTLYTVSITGRIEFDDPRQFVRRGLYGNTVQLWFRNSAAPDDWYHPVYSADCWGTRNTHYDILDVNGNYNFNFSFDGNLSAYNEAIVIISRGNPAASMPVQANGILIYCFSLPTKWFSLSESVIRPINGSQTNITITGANGLVNGPDGAIMRNMMFSREFVLQRYGGNPPFSVPQISTTRTDLPSNFAGLFHPTDPPYIEIDDNAPELTTVSHEFGHYVNYKMWNNYLIGDQGCVNAAGQTIPDEGRKYKEGWAVFYSFAARNYASRTYGDDWRSWDDNTEVAAFQSPRFSGMRYTSTDPGISAFACYLWNLYDSYAGGNFEVTSYAGDNDDTEQSTRVFEKMRTPIKDCVTWYHADFKNGLSQDLQTSADNIWTFMMVNSGQPMRSAQTGSVSARLNSSNQVQLQWASQSYSQSQYYGNYENGYRIYKDVSGSWQLIQTAAFGTNSYTDPTGVVTSQYKVTSYNSSGESYGALLVSPLRTSVSGPTAVYHPEKNYPPNSYTWSAYPVGGTLPYNILWYKTLYGYTNQVGAGSSYSETYYYDGAAGGSSQFDLRADVTDGSSPSQFASASITVTEYHSGGGGIEPIAAPGSDLQLVLIPEEYSLGQNFPNPFNPETEIHFGLPEEGNVRITVSDILGRDVATLTDQQWSAGFHSVRWNGASVGSGIYFCRISASGESGKQFTKVMKMLLAK